MTDIAAIWAAILAEEHLEQGWHRRRIRSDTLHDLYAAVLQPGGRPALLLEVPASDVPAEFETLSCRGFETWPEPLRPGPHGTVRLCLGVSDAAFSTVFAVLCDDVSQTVATTSSGREAVRAWAQRLNTWLAFMRRFDPGGLSDQAVIGLTAELSALRAVVISAVGEASGVDAWRGPCGVAHDFVLPGCDLEVKGSTEHPPKRIEIANLDQLDVRPNAILLLSIFEIAEDNAGASLPETVASLRTVIMGGAPEALTGFDDRLLLAGYSDAQANLYRKRYSVRNVSFYRVEEGFPRLVPSDVPSGVERVRYAIDLAAAAAFRLSGNTLPDLISEAGGHHGA